jgi:hypothetical protein
LNQDLQRYAKISCSNTKKYFQFNIELTNAHKKRIICNSLSFHKTESSKFKKYNAEIKHFVNLQMLISKQNDIKFKNQIKFNKSC